MKQKVFLIVLPTFIIILSILTMTSGAFLKQSFGENDKVMDTAKTLEQQLEKRNWQQAKNDVSDMLHAWDQVVSRVQFSVEREMINQITETLYKLKGSIFAEDYSAAMQQLHYFYILWEQMGE